eukprot:CAMPEP_0119040350 /NCGR_PEP_ID=MMETSP1177-20130426/10241_1 /TAXON_ID=2985 /ORGANISM="Ochromonas sp, Strain CCMP1899" /LENGTH=423 /DNA_ID=CAMNT_0007005305 /DNA_START=1498 /DNA_END=2769 /DNA_ORIENTATION=+
MTGSPYVSSMVASRNSILIAFTERTLRLVLRDDQAKLAEMKLRIKGADLELANILNYPPACALFEEYMIGEHAPENLFFWKAVERFEDLCTRLEKQLEKLKNGEDFPTRTGTASNKAGSTRIKTTASTRIPVSVLRQRSTLVDESESNSTTGPSEKSPKRLDPIAALQGRKAINGSFLQLRNIVKGMMEQYVYEGSPNQVNLPGKLRVVLEKEVNIWLAEMKPIDEICVNKENETDLAGLLSMDGDKVDEIIKLNDVKFRVPKELWTKAKSECYMIMRKDTFARWRFTEQFSTFFENLQPLASVKNLNTPTPHDKPSGRLLQYKSSSSFNRQHPISQQKLMADRLVTAGVTNLSSNPGTSLSRSPSGNGKISPGNMNRSPAVSGRISAIQLQEEIPRRADSIDINVLNAALKESKSKDVLDHK